MARTITLTELLSAFRRRGEYDNSATLTDAMAVDFINSAIAEVHNMVVARGEDYHLNDATAVTTAGLDYVVCPADFFKLAGLDVEVSASEKYRCRSMALADRHRFLGSQGRPAYYRLRGTGTGTSGSRIVLSPVPDRVYTLRIHYYTAAVKLAVGADVYDGIGGFEEMVLQLALFRADEREQRPSAQGRMAEAMRLFQQYSAASDNRDLAEPQYLMAGGMGHCWEDE